ncbi:uncharacterized protein LOC134274668 [Saccostrea cucullata]|uniref:uncharacterized protein LOC134274668 n=2 Tax=Saccostrea cuccullata TaxID=36930 RepID=UPI002ED33A5F
MEKTVPIAQQTSRRFVCDSFKFNAFCNSQTSEDVAGVAVLQSSAVALPEEVMEMTVPIAQQTSEDVAGLAVVQSSAVVTPEEVMEKTVPIAQQTSEDVAGVAVLQSSAVASPEEVMEVTVPIAQQTSEDVAGLAVVQSSAVVTPEEVMEKTVPIAQQTSEDVAGLAVVQSSAVVTPEEVMEKTVPLAHQTSEDVAGLADLHSSAVVTPEVTVPIAQQTSEDVAGLAALQSSAVVTAEEVMEVTVPIAQQTSEDVAGLADLRSSAVVTPEEVMEKTVPIAQQTSKDVTRLAVLQSSAVVTPEEVMEKTDPIAQQTSEDVAGLAVLQSSAVVTPEEVMEKTVPITQQTSEDVAGVAVLQSSAVTLPEEVMEMTVPIAQQTSKDVASLAVLQSSAVVTPEEVMEKTVPIAHQLMGKLNEVENRGDLPIDLALSSRQESIAMTLVNQKVDVNHRDNAGKRLIHKAIKRGGQAEKLGISEKGSVKEKKKSRASFLKSQPDTLQDRTVTDFIDINDDRLKELLNMIEAHNEESDDDDYENDPDFVCNSDSDDSSASSDSEIVPLKHSKKDICENSTNVCGPAEKLDSNREKDKIIEPKQQDNNYQVEDDISEKADKDCDMPSSRSIAEEECVFDDKYRKIYTKRFKKTNTKSKSGRNYDRVHACLFCCKLVTNIQTHLENKHCYEQKVKEISDLKKELSKAPENQSELKEEIRTKQSLLRNEGDNKHNMKVVEAGEGELLISRRRGKFNMEKYGPCPNCKEWIVLSSCITKHNKVCPAFLKTESPKSTKGIIIIQSKIMTGKIAQEASSTLKKEVFPIMRQDNITKTAVADPLIVALGDVWLMKCVDNKRKRKYYCSFRMRLAARLLHLLRKESQCEASLWDFLTPGHFDLVAACALKACNEENGDLVHPTTAIKLGFDISRLAAIKLACCIKKGLHSDNKSTTDFIKLVEVEWGTKVKKLASTLINERHFNKPAKLPFAEDVCSLTNHILQELEKLNLAHLQLSTFRRAVVLAQCRLLLYNKRRPGELEALRLDTYHTRLSGVDKSDLAMREGLTDLEQHLLESQEICEVRGKAGRGVPILIPEDVKSAMNFITNVDIRTSCGVRCENIYVFANKALGVLRAGDCLEEVKSEVDLQYPERILATNMRKYTATLAQVIGLKDEELRWLCNHLGHTEKVHEAYYRCTSSSIERIEIAKLMIIQERNLVGKCSGKKLSEIQFEDLLPNEDTERTDEEKENSESGDDDQDSEMHNESESLEMKNLLEDNGDDACSLQRKRAKPSDRVKWTSRELEEVREYFSSYLDGSSARKCPGREECKESIRKSKEKNGVLQRRKWETIKKKVSYLMHFEK